MQNCAPFSFNYRFEGLNTNVLSYFRKSILMISFGNSGLILYLKVLVFY